MFDFARDRARVWCTTPAALVPGFLVLLAACGEAPAVEETRAPDPISLSTAELLRMARAPGADVTLLNVWATSCVPCVAELPDLARLTHEYADRGLRTVLVSADFDATRDRMGPVLTRAGIRFPTYWLDDSIESLIEAMPLRWSGAIPVTVVFDASGKPRRLHEGQATYEEMEALLREVLGPGGGS